MRTAGSSVVRRWLAALAGAAMLSVPATALAQDDEADAFAAAEQEARAEEAKAGGNANAAAPLAGSDDAFYAGGVGTGAGELLEAETGEGPSLDIYGFADFSFYKNISRTSASFRKFPHEYSSFWVGNLNIYLAGDLSEQWKSLIEFRLLYLPNGTDQRINPDGTVDYWNTNTTDYAETERTLRWGGVEIERAYLEWQAHQLLTVRFGQWLTPYGIWNVDHGSPTIIGVMRPYIIGEELFPERQTGIEVFGAVHKDATTFGYHATISNGRGPRDAFKDLGEDKALGGRLFLRNTSLGTLQIGVSGYRGYYTDRGRQYVIGSEAGHPILRAEEPIKVEYQELSLAADLKWEYDGFLLQSEAVANERVYDDNLRPTSDEGGYLTSDHRRFGAYGLIGYRTPWLGIMPYTIVEHYNYAGSMLFPHINSVSFGLNVQVDPNVVFKAQYFAGNSGTLESPELVRGAFRSLALQAAWAF